MAQTHSRPFAVFDIDGTIFRSGLYRELVLELIKRGLLSDTSVDEIRHKETTWRLNRNDATFFDYDTTLLRHFEDQLPKLQVDDYDSAVQTVIRNQKNNCYRYTSDLVRRLKTEGYFMIALSASQIELVSLFAENYGFDAYAGLIHERDNGRFTGKSIRLYKRKHLRLQSIINDCELSYDNSYGVGDSEGDIDMLKLVEHPIAFNPDQALLDYAKLHEWNVVVERKGCTYQLAKTTEGYTLQS